MIPASLPNHVSLIASVFKHLRTWRNSPPLASIKTSSISSNYFLPSLSRAGILFYLIYLKGNLILLHECLFSASNLFGDKNRAPFREEERGTPPRSPISLLPYPSGAFLKEQAEHSASLGVDTSEPWPSSGCSRAVGAEETSLDNPRSIHRGMVDVSGDSPPPISVLRQADVTSACSILNISSWKCFYIRSIHPTLICWVGASQPVAVTQPDVMSICCPACKLRVGLFSNRESGHCFLASEVARFPDAIIFPYLNWACSVIHQSLSATGILGLY